MKIAFVAALEREVKPLVRNWRIVERDHQGRRYRFFEDGQAVLVCAGMGAEAARRATAAVTSFYSPQIVWSIGFAGALDPSLKVGDSLRPQRVIDAGDSSATAIVGGHGTLVSYAAIASPQQKSRLFRAFAAQAVDMEAAAVARGARACDVDFAAYKVISDECNFEFPAVERFVRDGQFRQGAFIAYVAIRPWLWSKVLKLATDSGKASDALCRWLAEYIAEAESLDNKSAEVHPMKRA
jgi:adenosylhomocysteine nucleosidase